MSEIIVPKHRQLNLRHEGLPDGLVKPGITVFANGRAHVPLTTSVRCHVSGSRVQVFDSAPGSHGEMLLDLPWNAAKWLAGEMKKMAIEKTEGVIQVIEADTLLIEVPVNTAFRLAKVIRAQAAQAQQNAEVLRVIQDQALFIRTKFPIALTRNPEVFKEAGNEAAWNTDLRRFFPGGVPEGATFGHPGLFDKPRKRHTIGAGGVPSAETFGRIGGR